MRKIFVVQCHPRNIFNIELFLNYGIYILSDLMPATVQLYGLLLYYVNVTKLLKYVQSEN